LKDKIGDIKHLWKTKNSISFPNNNLGKNLKIIDQIGHFFSPGDYYYYIFNFETLMLEYLSGSVKDILGLEPHELNLEKMLGFYHPDDLEKMVEKENAVLKFKTEYLKPEEITEYKTVYLIRYLLPDGKVKRILHQAKAINISKDYKIQQVLGVHADVTYLNIPIDHKISFISDRLPSYYSLDPKNLNLKQIDTKKKFTDQERKIIIMISEGKSSSEICEDLFITENTLKSHRKNILRKGEAKNTPHLIANCIREGII
jgi:DNA-binding CsgD family transcriptional regulator